MIYKLKHIPTGLYYQPHKHRGSNLSKRGKIYQTATHGLSSAFRERDRYNDKKHNSFPVYCAKNSQVHKLTINKLNWSDYKYSYQQVVADTNINDWIIEEIK